MNLPKFTARTTHLRWGSMVCGLLLLPVLGWAEPPPPTLAEQLERARAAKDDAAVVELCRRQLVASPNHDALLREMFLAQLALKDCDRAAETLARLAKGSWPAALVAEWRGDLAQAAGKPLDEALSPWKEALADGPADAPALLGKIADALDAASRWPEAAEAFRAFLRAKPNHAARTARLAVCLLNAGQPEEADKQAQAASRLDAADETVKAVAPMFDRLRPQLAALRKLGERINTPWKGAPGGLYAARLDRALLYHRAGAYHAALEDARKAAEVATGPAVAARLLQGGCYWRLARPQEAVALRVANIPDSRWFDDPKRCARLRAPDELTDREDPAAVVRAYAARALTLLDGQPVLAQEDMEKAVRAEEKIGRRTADTEVLAAAVLRRNDRPAEALAAARRATDADPRNPDGWALCGRLAQEAADFAIAVENLSRALSIREDAAWLRRRETCLRVLGRNAEADRDARRAAQLPAAS